MALVHLLGMEPVGITYNADISILFGLVKLLPNGLQRVTSVVVSV